MYSPMSSTDSAAVEHQGPRPAPPAIQRESHRIQKPSRKPVIIYMVAPKVIHAEASEFMSTVQRLTGLSSSPPASGRSFDDDRRGAIGHGERRNRQFPVKVKARAINRAGHVPSARSPISPIFLRDLNGLWRGGDHDGEGAAASQDWMGGSPSYLDIFGQFGDQ